MSAVTDALPLKDVAIEKIKRAMTNDATLKTHGKILRQHKAINKILFSHHNTILAF